MLLNISYIGMELSYQISLENWLCLLKWNQHYKDQSVLWWGVMAMCTGIKSYHFHNMLVCFVNSGSSSIRGSHILFYICGTHSTQGSLTRIWNLVKNKICCNPYYNLPIIPQIRTCHDSSQLSWHVLNCGLIIILHSRARCIFILNLDYNLRSPL